MTAQDGRHIEGHEDVARKQWPHRSHELPVALACFLFHRQEGLEALALEVLVRDVGAVRLQLRKKPACAAIVECHHGTSLKLYAPHIART